MSRSFAALAPLLATLLFITSCGFSDKPTTAKGPAQPDTNDPGDNNAGVEAKENAQIVVLSNRADMLSGGDALIEIIPPKDQSITKLNATLNGADISGEFAQRANQRWMGRIKTMIVGENTLIVRVNDLASITSKLRNYPNEGPIFSGPPVPRLHCQDGGEPLTCNQAPEYTFLYKSSQPGTFGLKPYDVKNPPSDIANTTTDHGVTVPFVVRQERGYQDRDEYRILTLFKPGQSWEPWQPQPQWNRKVLITHGGNCGTSFTPGTAKLNDFSGTFNDVPVIEQSYVTGLGLGFAVMSTALNNGGHNCDVVLQAESMVMAKERIVEQYGPIRYTLGTGCSGGSITQTTVANAYPGIYQGLITMCAYPDSMTAGMQFADLHMMRNYFESQDSLARGVVWAPTQWGDVEGHLSHVNAVTADEGLFKAATNPVGTCYGPNSYHPQNNPKGQRCGLIDWLTHIVGLREPALWTPMEKSAGFGFANLPLGNTGVQYGLLPFLQGRITGQQFADLNIHIGGLDIDIKPQPERTQAERIAVSNLYKSGMIMVGNNLNTVPILNFVGPDPGIAHDSLHAWWVRWRLDREHGNHDNHVMWAGVTPLIGDLNWVHEGIVAMDKWVAAMEKDKSTRPISVKVVANKPADLQDRCILPTGVAAIGEACVGVAQRAYAYGTPRTQAGDAIYGDNLDCELKPYDPAKEYGPLINLILPDQLIALKEVFKDGVCDYSKPPRGIVPTQTWLTYIDAQGKRIVGGKKLPPSPALSGLGLSSPTFNY
jgi:hypothetical protein